jgi:hypothetical protein
MTGRIEIDIERLLQWAYREELPKQAHGGTLRCNYDLVLRYGQMGALDIDENPQLPAALGAPHDDAFEIDRFVRALGWQEMRWDQNADALMGQYAGIVRVNARIEVMAINQEALVFMHARAGTRPDWRHDPFECHRMHLPYGSEHVVVGRDERSHRYREGAHCPLVWEPDPAPIVEARMEYAVWYSGLTLLAESLRSHGQLKSHIPRPPSCSPEPWRVPDPQPNVLRAENEKKPAFIGAPQRPRALPPHKTPKAGPVRRISA